MNPPSTHETLTDIVASELRRSGKYLLVEKNLEYHRRGLEGEFDVLAQRDKYMLEYYEIKSSDHPGAWNKAVRQFQRAAKAYPEYHWRFFYVTPQLRKEYAIPVPRDHKRS